MAKAKAASRRRILCPRCDTGFEISASTQSTMCPGCHKIVRTEDEEITTYCARQELFTEGTVEVAKKGHVIAEVRVRNLVVSGEVKGAVRARESVVIDKTGKIFGNLTTPLLTVKDGASLVGYCRIGVLPEEPNAQPPPAATPSAARPIPPSNRRVTA